MMRSLMHARSRGVARVIAGLLVLAVALAPVVAEARAGGGFSMGSRGMRTYSAPPMTRTAPYGAAPMQRSLTPRQAPSTAPMPGYGQPSYGGRSPFMSGLLGGLIGAGIGGLLFGHGFFGGVRGGFGFLGLLLQIFLIVLVVRWLIRRFRGGGYAFASPFGGNQRPPDDAPGHGAAGPAGSVPTAGAAPASLRLSRPDFEEFERLLKAVQASWSAQDLNTLRGLATPEMVGYFAEQLGDYASRGLRNVVSDVRLEQGDLAEAWTEGDRDYATVAMRYSMRDVTQDAVGHTVDGSASERVLVTELWTFMRAHGGRWLLSAIQQTR